MGNRTWKFRTRKHPQSDRPFCTSIQTKLATRNMKENLVCRHLVHLRHLDLMENLTSPKGLDLKQLGKFMDQTFSGRLNEEKIKPIIGVYNDYSTEVSLG